MDTSKLTREIKWRPAFDKRNPDPNKNYGIHGAEMAWYLKGPEGAIQFVIYTNWHLPHVRAEGEGRWEPFMWQPEAADIGYHSPVPRYEGQKPVESECKLLGGPCYYDGSSLNAEPILETLIRDGDEAVWEEMARYYEMWLLKVGEAA